MKAIAVERQPAEQRVQRRQGPLKAAPLPGDPGQGPARTYVHHVGMGRSGALQEKAPAVPFAGQEMILKGQTHGRPFIGKPAQVRFNEVKLAG